MAGNRLSSSALVIALLLVVTLFAGAVVLTAAAKPTRTGAQYAIIEFSHAPLALYRGDIPGLAATTPAAGEKADLTSAASQRYLAFLAAEHAQYRAWLQRAAPRAEVLREYSVVLNGLAVKANGVALEVLAQGPSVAIVSSSWLYRPTMSVSVGLIHAPEVWADLGLDLPAGDFGALRDIKVGVIDSGIDDTHPFLASCREPGSIAHDVFFSGLGTSMFGTTIVFDHGTHVAGTIGGCPTSGAGLPIDGVGATDIAGSLQGVAPGVMLHDYNVFPGYGAGFIAFGGAAFSHDIIAAVEKAVVDGMDVINLSLGGGVQGPHDTLAKSIDGAAAAGVVPAVAAGNSGPGGMTVESPGNAAGALTAGASTNPHYVGITVTFDAAEYGAAIGDFLNFDPAITAMTSLTTPANGCSSISEDLAGKIALIDRGACTFGTKIRNAEARGAAGVIVVNNVAGDAIAMGMDSGAFPGIPAAMLSKDDGAVVKAGAGGTATADGTSFREYLTPNDDIMAGFSSVGPTPFDFRIKPDVTAPGVNVLSSVFDGNFSFFQGTSMATPHLAGSAALLLARHPDWSPDDVKSALVNNADRTVTDFRTGTVDPGVLSRGGGRVNVARAADTPATLSPASVSFGLWTGARPVFASVDVTFRNQLGTALSCSLFVSGPASLRLSAGSISMAPGGSATVTIALSGGRALATGDYEGDLVADCGGTTLLAPWWVRVDRTGGFSHGAASLGLLAVAGMSAGWVPVAVVGSAWSGILLGLYALGRRRP